MSKNIGYILLAGLLAGASTSHAAETPKVTAWPAFRGDGSGSSDAGYELVDSLDQAKLAWKSGPVGLSGCMYPGRIPGEGWCNPIVADGRVYLYWFKRNGKDRVERHYLETTRGLLSLVEPPDSPEAFSRGVGYGSGSLTPKAMAELQSHIHADDIIACFDDRTGKTLWQRVFHERGYNHVRLYSPLCGPCIKDGVVYALGTAGRVYAMDAATGKTLWESNTGLEAERFEQAREICVRTKIRPFGGDFAGFNSTVNCAGGVVATLEESCRGGTGSGTVGLEAATGKRLWVIQTDSQRWSTPTVWQHDGKEYFLTYGDRMCLIEPKTGKVLWAIGDSKNRITGSRGTAISGDYVVLPKTEDRLDAGTSKRPGIHGPICYKISLTGANELWRLPAGDDPGIQLMGAVAISGDYAYVALKGGIACIELATGKEVGKRLPGINDFFSIMDHRIISVRPFFMGKTFPEMTKLEGKLEGQQGKGVEVGEFHLAAVANGRAYWRGRRNLWCYDFRKNIPPASTITLPAERDLGAIKDDAAKLAEVVEKEGWPTRAAAADLLRAMGEKAKPVSGVLQKLLLTAAAASDWGDVDLMLETLLAIDPAAVRPAVPALAKLLESKEDRSVRLGCHALTLIGAGAAEATPSLLPLLAPEKPEIAAEAARTLGGIGPAASAALPSLLKCLESKDSALAFHAAKALCHIGPTDPETRAATIESVLAQNWFMSGWGEPFGPPRLKSYKAMALSLLGKEALPALLKRAKKAADAGEHRNVCELASAAFAIDPKSASDFLPVLADSPVAKPGRKKPSSYGIPLKATEDDLKGTFVFVRPLPGGGTSAKPADEKKAVPDLDEQ